MADEILTPEQALDCTEGDLSYDLYKSHEALRADRDRLAAELAEIDAVMARRPALDKPTRRQNIEHAITTAGKATDEVVRLTQERDRLYAKAQEAAISSSRVVFCQWCYERMDFSAPDVPVTEARDRMRQHDLACPENPLVQDRDRLAAEVERMREERDAAKAAAFHVYDGLIEPGMSFIWLPTGERVTVTKIGTYNGYLRIWCIDPKSGREVMNDEHRWREACRLAEAPAPARAMTSESLARQHERKQDHADGFQAGWHAALQRVADGDSVTELRGLVPDTAPSYRAERDQLRAMLDDALSACRLALSMYDRHDLWCGYRKGAPGDSIHRQAAEALRAVVGPAACLTCGTRDFTTGRADYEDGVRCGLCAQARAALAEAPAREEGQ